MHLSSELDTLCFALFMRCDEFERAQTLRALFVTDTLKPFAEGLPDKAGSKKDFVTEVKAFLLAKELADGRPLLLPFLETLRGRYEREDKLHHELQDLYQKVLALTQRAPTFDTQPIALNHHFICYSPLDGGPQAEKLHAALHKAELRPWLDRRDTPAGYGDTAAREAALRDCVSVLVVLTPASASGQGGSVAELRKALQYKKPIVPLLFTPSLDVPLLLGNRPVLNFTGIFEKALSELQRLLAELNSPAAQLRELEYRLADAERELRTASDEQRPRIERDIAQLEAELNTQRTIARDPEAAARTAAQRTEAALERERQPERPATGRATSRFINPPPLTAPGYFQGRQKETKLIADFLRDPAQRLLTLTGRGGVGKTALVCRLLKALENGYLPDDLGEMKIDGIVYLSAIGSHRISFPNLFADLLKLLPSEVANKLDSSYKDPHKAVPDKILALCEELGQTASDLKSDAVSPDDKSSANIVVLLDNLEDLLDPTTHAFTDVEMDAALRALLAAPPHPLKVILTTRIAPPELLVLHPERQMPVYLDEGLPSPYAEAVLRAGDHSGVLGLKNASDDALAPAVAYTRGYPRALEALTAALNADRATTLAELLAGPPPDNVVKALVGQAYSRLDPVAQKVLQALAIYGRPVPAAAVDYLLQPFISGLDSTPVLNRLVNMRFVRKEGKQYYMHPVDKDYALQRIGIEAKDWKLETDSSFQSPVRRLQRRAADYFRQIRTPRTSWKTLADLAPQLAEIDLHYAVGDYDTTAQVLTEIDFNYLLLWGHYRLMIEQHERLQKKLKDTTLKQISAGNLGTAYAQIGQIPRAIEYTEQVLIMARENKHRQFEGAVLGNLGNRYAALGQIHRAIKYHEQALTIAQEIGAKQLQGNQLGSLGNRYADLGETRRAIEFYEQALAIAREIGDRRGEGTRLGSLGNCYTGSGETRRAIEFYEQALAIAREIGDRRGESNQLTGFGNCYMALGETHYAIEFYEQGLVIAHEIGDKPGEGRHLSNLGDCYSRVGDYQRALEYYRLALANAREIGNRYGEVKRLTGMAEVLIDQTHHAQAVLHLQASVNAGLELNNPEVSVEAYYSLALAYLYSGDLPAARVAIEQARQYDVPTNNHNVLVLLGVIALRQNDLATAREGFEAAVAAADALLALTPELYGALDAKALALAGLGLPDQARAAYQASRAINRDAGVVQRITRLLRQLPGGVGDEVMRE